MNVKMNFELYLKFYKISKLKMGQKQTKQALEYYIPTKKNFKLSYCVQENVSEVAEKKEYINLSKLIEEYNSSNLILQVLYYKCKHEGYSFKENPVSQISYRIDHILEYISDKGLYLQNNAILNDIKINRVCYEPNLNNIYSLLNKGNILLAGIILTEKFIIDVLKMDVLDYHDIMSDIILIVGYDTTTIFLKTMWCENLIKIDNKFIRNIREIWDIQIQTFF